ncbi:DNA-directed DNA polymerase alpha subunit pol12 [Linnemannia zychae]|nr:DNA-directed DNA polymerase alpha subunit pol12 [Linnemannia zychae]
MNQEQALIDIFGDTLAANPAALKECLNLLRIYRIEPETLHSKWEAYIMNSTSSIRDEDDSSMTTTHLEGFKNSLRRTLELKSQQGYQNQAQSASRSSIATPKKAQFKTKFQGSTHATRINHDMDIDYHNQYNSQGPMSTARVPANISINPTQPSASSKQFALRKNVLETEETLNSQLELRTEPPRNNHIEMNTESTSKQLRYRNEINMVVAVEPYRYMFEKIADKGEALDDRIDAFAALYKETYPETEFYNPAYPSQSIVTVVGRICSDANEGKANEQSLLLETSRSLGSGARVKLDLMEVKGYNFFPGQIVVLSGVNSHGSVFAVTRVHELPTFPMAGATPEDLENFQYRKLAGQPIKMIVAAGPYTLSDNLLFEPFAALMEHVNSERPDILLLMGPFISSTHPMIVSGDIDMTAEEYFENYISRLLISHQNRFPNEMQILLVPSLQDIIHETLVMPQPRFEHPSALKLPAGTYCLPNPAQFTINEMVFAVNTADILMHLNGDEISRNPGRSDRMSRLSKYIIDQRNMHPVYPGLASDPDSSVDFSQVKLMDLQVCPDVIILPSKLKHFAKIVDNVVVVNPNQLSKMQSGGIFAKLTIHPISENALSTAVMMMDEDDESTMSIYHRVYDRCRVDLIRV